MKLINNLGTTLLLVVLLLISSTISAQTARIEAVDHIVAVVDEDVVVRSELDHEIKKVVSRLRQ
ncbi:MAG: hypothetical protein GY779_12200, partial [Gammaproteobacteria bacterium]|nr:hypothetical protein [Gammaproteobacteria bacterium]